MIRRLLGKKIVRDTLVLQGTTLLQAAIYFLTSVLIANYLGKAGLGRWDFARSLFLFAFFLVTMGVGNATVARYSLALAEQDRKRCIDALASLLKLGSVAFVAVVTLGWWLLPLLSDWWTADAEVGHIAWILCTAGLFEVVRTLTQAALIGARQMMAFARFDATINVARLLMIVAVVKWTALGLPGGEPGIMGIAWVFVANLVFGGVLGLWAYRRAQVTVEQKLAPPPLGEVLAAVPGSSLRGLSNVSFVLGLNKGLNDLLPRYGSILIAGYSFEDNGAYSVAFVISWGLAQLVGGVNRALLPALGFKIGNSGVPFEKLGRVFLRVTLASGLLFAVVTGLSIPLVPWVLGAFYEADFAESYGLFLGLVLGNFFIGFGAVIEPFYLYAGRLKAFTAWNLAWCTLWVLATTAVSRHIGPKGVAVAVGCLRLFVIFHLVYIWRYFLRARTEGQSGGPSPPS